MKGTDIQPRNATGDEGKERSRGLHRAADEEEGSGRRARKRKLQRLQYQRRLDRWTRRYGSLRALQSTFGTGPPWGDLSPERTRALYHALLPRSLVALSEMELMRPEELAPLAYEARMAAKEYARSRCVWTGRVATSLFDQYRSLRDRGRLLGPGSSGSMSWEEIWDKYEARIVWEECEGELEDDKVKKKRKRKNQSEDLATRIYMQILEKSCSTNQAFDSLFLSDDAEDGNLTAIASQLENDVREILLSPKDQSKATKKQEKMKRKQQKALQKNERRQRKNKEREEKRRRTRHHEEDEVEDDGRALEDGGTVPAPEYGGSSSVRDNSQQYEVLRVLAGTRRRFRLLLDRSN